MQKSGKSTDSFIFFGKIYRFFAEIRRIKDRLRGPEFLSLKAASCLSKFTQTWRKKPANSSDMVYFSGKSSRHGEKIRQIAQKWPAFQANRSDMARKSGATERAAGSLRARTAHLARNPSTPSVSAQETRYPHEVDTGLKSLCDPNASLTCGFDVVARAADLRGCRRCTRR